MHFLFIWYFIIFLHTRTDDWLFPLQREQLISFDASHHAGAAPIASATICVSGHPSASYAKFLDCQPHHRHFSELLPVIIFSLSSPESHSLSLQKHCYWVASISGFQLSFHYLLPSAPAINFHTSFILIFMRLLFTLRDRPHASNTSLALSRDVSVAPAFLSFFRYR